ncbi:ImmA/IrrE family metallo-endopeptidase [Alcanivorax xiamenensis]|uniref:ImmA/IrrE family metallo-endopeptidase n=1 Tax=Alcanivorax xiamenensis TaxID=1177156 RepID=UPI0013596A92|nr:ImmA/IrrE family metallo-endopeptidase [Alcanivorax xiamenensis]
MNSLQDVLNSYGSTYDEISASLGVKVETIEALLTGENVALGEARKVAEALGLSLSVLAEMRKSDSARDFEFFFRRANPKAPPKEIIDIKRYENLIGAASAFLDDGNNADWIGCFYEDRLADYEEMASFIRNEVLEVDLVSPLSNLPFLLDKIGVYSFVTRSTFFEGVSVYYSRRPYIFISPRFSGRMLFTLAHEFSHLLLHVDPGEDSGVFDEYREKDMPSFAESKMIEREADILASSLLLPARGVGLCLKKIREVLKSTDSENIGDIEILYLANIYGVSFEVAGYRLERLGVLPAGGTMALVQHIRKQHGSPEKRAEAAGLPARPEFKMPQIPISIVKSAIGKISAGEFSLGFVREKLELPIKSLMAANLG